MCNYSLMLTPVHTVLHSSALLPTTLVAAFNFGDFNNGMYYVIKTTVVESNPDTELTTQQTFGFSPCGLAMESKMPVMAMSVASDGEGGGFSWCTGFAQSLKVFESLGKMG